MNRFEQRLQKRLQKEEHEIDPILTPGVNASHTAIYHHVLSEAIG